MSLFVNTNVSALQANRQLFNSSVALDVSFQRLSSGFRINSAADDAAGLQISDRMTSQIQGLDQAVRNANDGISVAQTAEGALSEITTALQRMRQLAVQAENGINSSADKVALQKEVSALKSEIDRISDTTQFGGKNLLDGSFSSTFLVGANSNQKIDLSLSYFFKYGAKGLGVDSIDLTQPDPVLVHYTGTPDPTTTGSQNISIVTDYFAGHSTLTLPGGGGNNNAEAIANFLNALNPDKEAYAEDGVVIYKADLGAAIAGSSGGVIDAIIKATRPLLLTKTQAIDKAIEHIGEVRSELGAIQNRFQSTIRNLSNISENVSSARSRIRDTDFAQETAELTRNQIIQQASTTVLAQANTRPQSALSLLRA